MGEKIETPTRGGGDVIHTVLKAGLSAVPIVGGPAAELFAAIIVPPLEKRRERWIEYVGEAIEELKKRVSGFAPEQLSQNESFVSTLLYATQIASRTHQEEKLSALRNAILNAVLPGAPSDTMQQVFLNHIDSLTPWHIKLMHYFDSPVAWGKSLGRDLEKYLFELKIATRLRKGKIKAVWHRGEQASELTGVGVLCSRLNYWSMPCTNSATRELFMSLS